jgi:5-formyltetrahydrofolate cyclo-ligase
VLVPLVGFDRRGNRLGSGGGWYDRSFAFLRDVPRPARPILVGIGYHFQEVEKLDAQPWDIPMDFIATDRELIACTVTDAMTP